METGLSLIEENGARGISSMDIAQRFGKEHKQLLLRIDKFRQDLNKPEELFIKTREGYLITQEGCAFLAHKTSGINGTRFTEAVGKAFLSNRPMSQLDVLYGAVAELKRIEGTQVQMQGDIAEVKSDVTMLKEKIDNVNDNECSALGHWRTKGHNKISALGIAALGRVLSRETRSRMPEGYKIPQVHHRALGSVNVYTREVLDYVYENVDWREVVRLADKKHAENKELERRLSERRQAWVHPYRG